MSRIFDLLRRRRPVLATASSKVEVEVDDRRQEMVNGLVVAGWREQWSTRRTARSTLWVRHVGDECLVYAGTSDRPTGTKPLYRVDGERVFRLDDHPDGPSSVPFLSRRARGVYPGAGYPGGADGARVYKVERLTRIPQRVTIRLANPGHEGAQNDAPPSN